MVSYEHAENTGENNHMSQTLLFLQVSKWQLFFNG